MTNTYQYAIIMPGVCFMKQSAGSNCILCTERQMVRTINAISPRNANKIVQRTKRFPLYRKYTVNRV